MTHYKTRRDYLVSKGLASQGRGRLSSEAHAAIDAAISEGHTFGDVKSSDTKSADVKVGAAAVEQYFGPSPEPRFTGDWYFRKDGKVYTIGGAAACFNCGVSLMYHRCNTPRVLTQFSADGHVPVFQ